MKATIGGISVEVDFMIKTHTDHVLMAGIMQSSAQKLNMCAALCGMANFMISHQSYDTTGSEYLFAKTKLGVGYSGFYYGIVADKKIGKEYVLSTKDNIKDDYYDYLMNNFKFPLMKEWKTYLFEESMKQNVVSFYQGIRILRAEDKNREIQIGNRTIALQDICLYEVGISENILRQIISEGLSTKKIQISPKQQQPVIASNMDEYMMKYGNSIGTRMENTHIRPKTMLKRDVDGLALLSKKLYAQQAACDNGIVAMMQEGKDKFVYVVEEMGCGKTIQGIAAAEAYFNQKWLRTHPGKTLKDCFEAKEVSYRVAIMCPSHLVEKWKNEIEQQIPYAKVHIVSTLSQVTALRERRKVREGKEVYIFSKEFAKADTYKRPVPTRISYRYPTTNICLDCLIASKEDGNERIDKLLKLNRPFFKKELLGLTISPMKVQSTGIPTCIRCKKHRAHRMYMDDYGKYSGMICPNCDSLLIKESVQAVTGTMKDEFQKLVLQPRHFARKNESNKSCSCCGSSLWEDNVAPLDISITGKQTKRESKSPWSKIKFYSNYAKEKKGTMDKTAYALKGYELSCVDTNGVGNTWVSSNRDYGPRRTPAARYCKKYLKGAFDVFIADEAHLYEGIYTEQGIAMHHLVKASKFTIPMSGTISNGTAAAFFTLFYMTMPQKMVEAGYPYSPEGILEFSKKYGVVETTYEHSGNDERCEYRESGRGKQIASPRIKPGISPLLYVDFLVDHSVMLNIGDMSNHMPPLNEHVVELDMPQKVAEGYKEVISDIKAVLQEDKKMGRALLSTMLQFGLSYPDKPYGRSPIYSLWERDTMIVEPVSLDEYSHRDVLLTKEKTLVDIINAELAENRNVFVYTEYSGEGEANISYRLKDIIESHCNVKGQVEVLESKDVKPKDREVYIKRKSDRIKVWITNYRNVETGIDLVGEYEGRAFNYPTLIFMQTGMSLSSVWQASRRSYRLNQAKECRTYYLCYRNTFQKDMLEMMSKKISAASAIQGNFSASALENMMGTEDPTVILAKKLMKGSEEAESTVDVEELLAQTRNNIAADNDESGYIGADPVTFYEVMGQDAVAFNAVKETAQISLFSFADMLTDDVDSTSETADANIVNKDTEEYKSILSFLNLNGDETIVVPDRPKRRKIPVAAGQFSFF